MGSEPPLDDLGVDPDEVSFQPAAAPAGGTLFNRHGWDTFRPALTLARNGRLLEPYKQRSELPEC